jgi:3-hydroxyisobutyrate dehydrogenase
MPEALATFEQAGGKTADSALAAVQGAEVVVSMLPAGKHVAGLYTGPEGLLAQMPAGTLVVDSSTIDVATAQEVGAAAAAADILFVDAPVSGGVSGATAGTLSFIVGGEAASFERAKPFLEAMGKNIFHAGAAGAGQIAKMCNNMLLSVLMAGTAEALQLGIDNGLDPKVLSDIMVKSSGRNWTLEIYNPVPGVMEGVPSSNDYQGGFMVDLMNKDLGLALGAADSGESMVPMGKQAAALFAAHGEEGNGRMDFSSIFQHYGKG